MFAFSSHPGHPQGHALGTNGVAPRIAAALAFGGALLVNGLANRLPLGGRTTGELSALYPNLFVPAGVTFAIWGVIYLLVGAWCIVQFLPSGAPLGRRLAPAFATSSVLNAGWLFAWHHQLVTLSLVVMAALLVSLLVLNHKLLRPIPDPTHTAALHLARATFGIYLGWVLVATLVNATVFGVHIGWGGAPLTPALWAALLTMVGAGVAIFTFRSLANPWVAASVVWAFAGIALARRDEAPLVAWTAVGMLVLVAALALRTARSHSIGRRPSLRSKPDRPETPAPPGTNAPR